MIIAIIQDRWGSSRLPGKSMMEIGGKKVLQHVIDRAKKIKKVDKIVVAVSSWYKDSAIKLYCEKNNINCFYQDFIIENNVMLRLLLCGLVYDADYILRLPADQPFFSVEKANEIVKYCDGKNDYIAHYIKGEDRPTIAYLPAGTFIEGIRLDALYGAYTRLYTYTRLYKGTDIGDYAKEHVTPCFYLAPEGYKIKKIDTDKPRFLLSINDMEDIIRVRRLHDKGIIK